LITDAPWINLTYQIIGLAMALHSVAHVRAPGIGRSDPLLIEIGHYYRPIKIRGFRSLT